MLSSYMTRTGTLRWICRLWWVVLASLCFCNYLLWELSGWAVYEVCLVYVMLYKLLYPCLPYCFY
jgi:4-hydroxybenzoate polyprenyltransferase